MLQLTSLAQVGVHRTCIPLQSKYEATPVGTFLDPSETGNIYSGMVMYRTGGDTVALFDGNTAVSGTTSPKPFGFAALDRNAGIDDVTQTGVNVFTVWIGGDNAYFQITAPAFDATQNYTVSTSGTPVYLYAGTGAQKAVLTSAAPNAFATPVAELIDVLGPTQIVVRLVPRGTL
jgi:hypothetical protein